MSSPLYLLPLDCANLLFESIGGKSRLILAHTLKSQSLIDRARRDVFKAKYGEFTQSEKNASLHEVIAKVRESEILLPKAIALRYENDRLMLKYKGEVEKGEISLYEIDQIHKRVKAILEELNQLATDFSPPASLKEQKNIKRRRFRFQLIFNHYERLYKETAAFYKFPAALAASFREVDCPPVKIGVCGDYLIYGTFLWDRRYEFYIRENSSLKCSFVIKFEAKELKCYFPRIGRIEACHFVMLKIAAAIFNRQSREMMALHHTINFMPLLYEVGLDKFNVARESALKYAKSQFKHLYEVLNLSSAIQENLNITTIYKKGMDRQMLDKISLCSDEIIFENGTIGEDYT